MQEKRRPLKIFVTGGTGYMGLRLIPLLRERGHAVTALARPGSENRLPSGVRVMSGDALDPVSLEKALEDCDTWVQLVGTPHPAPWKAKWFRTVDLRAVTASAEALPASRVNHYVYLSVAQPAPMMRAYVEARQAAESRIRESGVAATFLRPWYVLGPGHLWPYVLMPLYKLGEAIPFTREVALRLGLVTLEQMVSALAWAVENPPPSIRVLQVPDIRQVPPLSAAQNPATPGSNHPGAVRAR